RADRRGIVVFVVVLRSGRGSGTPHARCARLPSSLPSEGCMLASSSRFSGFGIVLARPLPAPLSSGCDRVRPPLQLRGSGGFAPPSLTRRFALTWVAHAESIGFCYFAGAGGVVAPPKPRDTVTNHDRPGSGNPSASSVWSFVKFLSSHATCTPAQGSVR